MSSEGPVPVYVKPHGPRTMRANQRSENSNHDQEDTGTITITIPPIDESRGSGLRGSASQLTVYEELELAPLGEKSLLSPSPSTSTPLLEDQQKLIGKDASPVEVSRSSSGSGSYGWKPVTRMLLRRTAPYVLSGAAFMIFGIGFVQVTLLPHIHSCPANSTCSARFDPNRSSIFNTLQTIMTYWLKVGTMISGYGLMKLSAYQVWILFSQTKSRCTGIDANRRTIGLLDLHIGAIKGGLLDAVRLLRRRKSFLTIFLILGIFGIDTGSNFIIGQSIIRSPGTKELVFEYPDVARLPASDIDSLNSDQQLAAISKVQGWALANDTTHGGALHGSLVVPDGRTNSSVNPVPGGAIMNGTFTCTGVKASSIATAGDPIKNITITVSGHKYIATNNMRLAVSETGSNGLATNRYLWFSNAAGILPNATKVNSTFYVTLCQHKLGMTYIPPISSTKTGTQIISPAIANIEGCDSMNMDDCVADSVSKTILSWWGGIGQSFWGLSCRGGVLGPLRSINEDGTINQPCKLTTDLWRETAASVLDGIMQTAATGSIADQKLVAKVESVDLGRWWLQALIPALTVLLYAMSVIYTCFLSRGDVAKLKEINLVQIMDAAAR
ncbi:hypothetical protein CPC08DRAFT_821620 [Agrocybe pediades]|nr:hypothetical protein CPC08DRAFT_821620 [Agrocybe pediades]